jgi:hypothetical protein
MTSRHAFLKRLSAAAGSLLLATTSAPAVYGPRLIIGDVYQQSSNTTSTNSIDPAACETRVNCYVLFQPVPNRQQVVIEHVSCWILTSDTASASISSVYLWSRNGTEPQFHQSYVVPVKTGVNNFVASGTVLHPLDVNERPFIAIWNEGGATMDPRCTISGRIVPAQ